MFCDSFCFKWTLTTVGKPGWSLSPAVGQEEQTAANNSSWQLMERRPLREWAREVREVKREEKYAFTLFQELQSGKNYRVELVTASHSPYNLIERTLPCSRWGEVILCDLTQYWMWLKGPTQEKNAAEIPMCWFPYCCEICGGWLAVQVGPRNIRQFNHFCDVCGGGRGGVGI